jgi:hypothetical protein
MTPNELRKRIQSFQKTLDSIKAQLETISEYRKSDTAQDQESPPPTEHVSAVVGLPPSIETYFNSENKERPSKRVWSHIEHVVAILGFLAIVAYVIVTACTFSEIKRQADTAHDQTLIMQRQLEAIDRPWISLDVKVTSPLTYDKNKGVQITFTFVPKNIGRSPGQNIWIDPRLTSALMGDDLRPMQKRICEAAATKERMVSLAGYILFPDRFYTQEIGSN